MRTSMCALMLVLSLSLVSAGLDGGFSTGKDYSKNGFGATGSVWMVTPETERLMGTSNGRVLVSMQDFDKALLVPEQYMYNLNGAGLAAFADRWGRTEWALDSSWPWSNQNSWASVPHQVPGPSNFVKMIDMQNRGGRYSYEGQYDVARTRIKAWKWVPHYN
ncbi:MAG TPA: hypothetical protein VJG90_08655 [Candidatus Nanoarchaeia archaeon]|nr:hypothetical protein [Candidatus Nanoarchaeia archaeon]